MASRAFTRCRAASPVGRRSTLGWIRHNPAWHAPETPASHLAACRNVDIHQPATAYGERSATHVFKRIPVGRGGRPDAYTANELSRRAGKDDRRHVRGLTGAESTVGSAARTNANEDSRSRGRRH